MPGFLARPDRPRVLYVIEQREYSGAEWNALPVMRADADPLLACPPGSPTEGWARAAGIPTVPLPHRTMRHSAGPLEAVRSVFRGLAGARDLRRVLRAHPERRIVYAVAFRSSLLTALAGAGLGRAAVWFVSDFPPPAPLGGAVRVAALLRCARAIATSEAAAERFAGRSRRLRGRTRVAYPGVDAERFAPRAGVARERARAVVLGHVSPTKRTDLAVEAARIVARERPEFALDVVGRAQYREEDFAFEAGLQASVAADPLLTGRVTFTGYAADPAAGLSRYGILLHCRPDEPFGIVVVEAMAAGLVAVVPDSFGPAEIVRHERSGLLYPPGDARAAAAQVLRLLADPGLHERLAAAGRAEAASRFSVAEQLARTEDVLETIAGSSGALSR